MSTSEFPVGTELVFAENREIEQSNKLDKNVVFHHVWNSCKPLPKFSSSTPTVTARRIQLMRIQLQNNPKLLEVWEPNVGDLYDEEEDDDIESFGYSSPEQYSGSSSKKKTSDKTSSDSDEILPAQYSNSSSKKTVSQKHLECRTENLSMQYCKKKTSGGSSPWSENAVPSSPDVRKTLSGKNSVCSTKIPSSCRSRKVPYRSIDGKSPSEKLSVCPTDGAKVSGKHSRSTDLFSSLSNKSTDVCQEDVLPECIPENQDCISEIDNADEKDFDERAKDEYCFTGNIAEQSCEFSDDEGDEDEGEDEDDSNENGEDMVCEDDLSIREMK